LSSGVQLFKPKNSLSNHLNETIFVFTGTLELMNRNDAKKNVEDAGGATKSALTKNTTHLVAGKNAGSKIEKAKSMAITILSEEKFIELLKNG
jgi:DNA ligase (NAD+)